MKIGGFGFNNKKSSNKLLQESLRDLREFCEGTPTGPSGIEVIKKQQQEALDKIRELSEQAKRLMEPSCDTFSTQSATIKTPDIAPVSIPPEIKEKGSAPKLTSDSVPKIQDTDAITVSQPQTVSDPIVQTPFKGDAIIPQETGETASSISTPVETADKKIKQGTIEGKIADTVATPQMTESTLSKRDETTGLTKGISEGTPSGKKIEGVIDTIQETDDKTIKKALDKVDAGKIADDVIDIVQDETAVTAERAAIKALPKANTTRPLALPPPKPDYSHLTIEQVVPQRHQLDIMSSPIIEGQIKMLPAPKEQWENPNLPAVVQGKETAPNIQDKAKEVIKKKETVKTGTSAIEDSIEEVGNKNFKDRIKNLFSSKNIKEKFDTLIQNIKKHKILTGAIILIATFGVIKMIKNKDE